MIIGNQNIFAFEFVEDLPVDPHWRFGMCCYWIGGERVGDFFTKTSLQDVVTNIYPILKCSRYRYSPHLFKLDDISAFNIIDKELFGEIRKGQRHLARADAFNISPGVDVFDDVKIFLVQELEAEKIIFSRSPFIEARSVILAHGTFDVVLKGFLSKISES